MIWTWMRTILVVHDHVMWFIVLYMQSSSCVTTSSIYYIFKVVCNHRTASRAIKLFETRIYTLQLNVSLQLASGDFFRQNWRLTEEPLFRAGLVCPIFAFWEREVSSPRIFFEWGNALIVKVHEQMWLSALFHFLVGVKNGCCFPTTFPFPFHSLYRHFHFFRFFRHSQTLPIWKIVPLE